MPFRKMMDGAVTALLYALAVVFIILAYNLYEPYLASVREQIEVAVFVIADVILVTLWLGKYWTRGVIKRGLILAWCLPVVALTTAEAAFYINRQAVLHAEGNGLKDLGQHFIVGYSRVDDIAPLAAKGLIGGIYVTHHNIEGRTASDVSSEIAKLQTIRRSKGLPPLIVTADQEGGIVSHLSPLLTSVPALSTLAALPEGERRAKACEYGEIHGRELAKLGITMNLAPVVDLRHGQPQNHIDLNSFIDQRAISDDPKVVIDVASNYIAGLNAYQVAATLKHFPGLGRAREDTHLFSAHIDAQPAELEATDWLPFRTLLANSTAQLMVGHAAVTAIDPGRPASHSKRVIDGLLRQTWNYQGLIMTDDLVMGAIYGHGLCSAVVESLNAGVDLLLVAFDGAQYYRIFECARSASARGEIDGSMLRKSGLRLDAFHAKQQN